jgi:hypothetical protein
MRYTIRLSHDTITGRHYVEDLTGEVDADDLPADGFVDYSDAENAALNAQVLVGGDVEFVGY